MEILALVVILAIIAAIVWALSHVHIAVAVSYMWSFNAPLPNEKPLTVTPQTVIVAPAPPTTLPEFEPPIRVPIPER